MSRNNKNKINGCQCYKCQFLYFSFVLIRSIVLKYLVNLINDNHFDNYLQEKIPTYPLV